ncbi:MAG: Fic family protein [Colwellia sp.]|nr:Fic family protein [Colwellia sp.]
MKYNWQHKDWPEFIYNPSDYDHVVMQFQKKAYSLQGRLEQLNIESQQEAHILLMVEEAINSSEIEGENLNREEICSSVARFLGLKIEISNVPSLKEEGIAALLINVRESLNQHLSKEKLCYWHKLLLQEDDNPRKPILKGDYRDETVDVIKDDLYGNVDVIFKAPGISREEVTLEMDQFFAWYNATDPSNECGPFLPGPVRAAVAHLWFVSIHPFEDGNGRIGRAIAEHALYQDFENPPLFSISATINNNRKQYYEQLQGTNEVMDISNWVQWFVNIVHDAQISAALKVDYILEKSKFWDLHKKTKLNERQHKAISKMFDSGPEGFITNGISNQKYRTMTKCSLATATRDLKDLVNKEVLYLKGSGKRNIRYLICFVENSVFKRSDGSSHAGSRDKFIEATLEKLLGNIQRNLDFHQDKSNSKLLEMIEHYEQLSDKNKESLHKLKTILSA